MQWAAYWSILEVVASLHLHLDRRPRNRSTMKPYGGKCGTSYFCFFLSAFHLAVVSAFAPRPEVEAAARRKGRTFGTIVFDGLTWSAVRGLLSLFLSLSRGSSFASRFGFSRLFELSTPCSLPSAGVSFASSQEFIQLGRAAHSFDRSRGSERVSELHAAPMPKRTSNPTRGQASMIHYPTATPPADFVIMVSMFQGSLRKSITKHRTSSLRATATIAFFLRVFCPPVSRS